MFTSYLEPTISCPDVLQEGVDTLTGLTGRLTAGLAQPGLHTSSLVGGKGALILAVLRPALALLKTILGMQMFCQSLRISIMQLLTSSVYLLSPQKVYCHYY